MNKIIGGFFLGVLKIFDSLKKYSVSLGALTVVNPSIVILKGYFLFHREKFRNKTIPDNFPMSTFSSIGIGIGIGIAILFQFQNFVA